MARSNSKTPPHSIAELLVRAKAHIAAGEHRLRLAAHDIATASEQGATQRAIAAGVGKSVGWVNGLLQWHRSGYLDGSPFGPAVAASRERADRVELAEAEAAASRERVQSTEHKPEAAAAASIARAPSVAAVPATKAPIKVPDLPATSAAASIAPAPSVDAPATRSTRSTRRARSAPVDKVPSAPVGVFKALLGDFGEFFDELGPVVEVVEQTAVLPVEELGGYDSEESQRLLMISAIENVKLSSIGDVWPKVIAEVGPEKFRCFVQVLKDAFHNYCEAERDRGAAAASATPVASSPADDFPDIPACLRRLH